MSRILYAAAGLAAGVGLATALPRTGGQAPPPAVKAEAPANRGLDANLYMQTAAEYRACCRQAYNLAGRRLAELAKAHDPAAKPPAVVLDLDETVFDNAGFQSAQLRANAAYDPAAWDVWERNTADVGLIPGAKEFVLAADKLGVAIVYISNRTAKNQASTKAILAGHGLPLPDESRLLLSTDTSNKEPRRKLAAEKFTLLLLVGDNLRDFDEQFKSPAVPAAAGTEAFAAAVAARAATVDAAAAKWGTEWVILPNPAYGEWQKLLGRGAKDFDLLVPRKE